jgi:hypothetical protein
MTVLPFQVPARLFPVEHRFLDLNGARIHYVDEGAGETLFALAWQPGLELPLSEDHYRALFRSAGYPAVLTITSGVGAWRVAEPLLELEHEVRIVVEPAGVGDLAQRLAYIERGPALKKAGGVLQTK